MHRLLIIMKLGVAVIVAVPCKHGQRFKHLQRMICGSGRLGDIFERSGSFGGNAQQLLTRVPVSFGST
jgi:hypothetical protein